jgi:hypothetical protein
VPLVDCPSMQSTGQIGLKMKLNRRILLIGLTALGLMGLSGASFAQSADMGELSDAPQDKIAQDNVAIVIPVEEMDSAPLGFHNWRGFALKDHESYVLRISIESVRPVGPMGVRRLLALNMTIEEIEKEILAKEGNVTYRGYLKFGESIYWLINIKVEAEADNLTLDADIADIQESLPHEIMAKAVGHVTVNTTSYEGGMNGQGKLIMIAGPRIGHYQILLDMDSLPPERAGWNIKN